MNPHKWNNIGWGAALAILAGCSPSHIGQDADLRTESIDPADVEYAVAWADSLIAQSGSEPYEQADVAMLELWGLAVDQKAVCGELAARLRRQQLSGSRMWPVVDDCADIIAAASVASMAAADEALRKLTIEYGREALARAEAVNIDPVTGLFRGLGCDFAQCRDEYPSWTRVTQAYMSCRLDRNVMYMHAYRSIAAICGEDEMPLRTHCDSMARKLSQAINDRMWLPKRGYHASMLYGNVFLAQNTSLDYAGECAAMVHGVAADGVSKWIMEHIPVTEQQLSRQYPMTDHATDVGWESARRHLLYCMAASSAGNRAALVHGIICAVALCSEPGAGYAEAVMMQGIARNTRYREALDGTGQWGGQINLQPDRIMAAWPRTRWSAYGHQSVAGYKAGERFIVMLDGQPEGVIESADYTLGARDSFTTVALVPVDDEGWEGFSSVIRRYTPAGNDIVIEAEDVAVAGTRLIRQRTMAGRYAELSARVNTDISFNVTVEDAGDYVFELVYADGTSTRYSQMRSLWVNGTRCGDFVMPRLGAGPSTKAVSSPVRAFLAKGRNSVHICVSEYLEPGSGCILLDRIRMIKLN